MFYGSTIRIFPPGGRYVRAQAPFLVMSGVWVPRGDALLDAGDQVICCYGQRSTVLQYGICSVQEDLIYMCQILVFGCSQA
jgi:hypothetical protein